MTAPLKHSDPITVDVALGERAYDIVIGRDLLPSLGGRIAALRPGARAAIVTDRTVAKHWLEPAEPMLSEDARTAAWAEGQAMTLEQAAAFALEEDSG